MDAVHKARILQLADHLERLEPAQFNMCRWLATNDSGAHNFTDDCHTVACIAGHTYLLFAERDAIAYPIDLPGDVGEHAKRLLGLTDEQADALFTPELGVDIDPSVSYESISADCAAYTLRHLAETERVDWGLLLTAA